MPDPASSFDELPELMLSLRSFGSRRGTVNESAALSEEQDRFFAPLLDSRRRAAQAASRGQVVAAFEARRLTALIDATLRAFATERFATRVAARRAFEAELFELVEPLREALQLLRGLAEATPAPSATTADEPWILWVEQLRIVFRVADSSWPPLRDALAASPPTSARDRVKPSRGENRQ